MKALDPGIQIGVILQSYEWNKVVLGCIGANADFGIVHIYPYPNVDRDKIRLMRVEDIFKEVLGPSLLIEKNKLSNISELAKEKTNKNLPLAITEYNVGIFEDEPIPYRHCLGTALLNAELLRIFMKLENNILMANYWDFANEYWGMVANDFGNGDSDLYKSYYKRPNFFVFQLYHEHFGDIMIDTDVKCASYILGKQSIPFLSVNASKSKNGKKLYLMVVNKNMVEDITASIQLKDFKTRIAHAWVLNGPNVEATNEKNHQEVRVKENKIDLSNRKSDLRSNFDFVFEPHSLTAIEIERE
jgi:alpha-L-arabinofuranosidase